MGAVDGSKIAGGYLSLDSLRSARSNRSAPNAAEPQPKRTPARTPNATRFVCVDTISSAVHPVIEALLSGPLVYVSGCYGCRPSA